MSTREVNTALAAMSKKEIIATLLASNPAFSKTKLTRKTRDDLVEFYGVELRRLIDENRGSILGSSLPK